MPNPSSPDAEASTLPKYEPWTHTPNALRNALIEISDLRSENQALQERLHTLLTRLREACAARGLPPPKLEDL